MTLKPAFVVALACAASGCVSLFPDPPAAPRTYTVQAAEEAQRFAPLPLVISVARPTAPRSLGGRDIAWRRGAELAYVDSAAWDSAAPEMLHTLMVDSLDRQGIGRAVVRVADGSLSDYELRWDLLRFEVDETDPRALVVRIEVTVRLLGAQSREVVAAHRVVKTLPVNDRSSALAAEALGQAARAVCADVGAWAYQELRARTP
jgi:ABC-type uncharacterized transport system auxiliary subunit